MKTNERFNIMDRIMVFNAIDDQARQIFFEVEAISSVLPEKVLDSITDDFMRSNKDGLPTKKDVLKGMCDYLQKYCF